MNKIYFDTEFTGLTQNTTLISIGLVSDTGDQFYAEFTDFDKHQVDGWIYTNVIQKLTVINSLESDKDKAVFKKTNLKTGITAMWVNSHISDVEIKNIELRNNHLYEFAGPKEMIAVYLRAWLDFIKQKTGAPSEMHGDHLAYDWVLFCQLFGGAMHIPESVHYIPQDLCTAFRENGINPDTARVDFSEYDEKEVMPHNSLFDAKIIKACFEKINRLKAQK